MKILVLGGGGREHALVWKLSRSPSVSKLWCIPGNGGIAQIAECLPGDLGDVSSLADTAQRLGADLTVVGPEQPLVLGIADEFARRGLKLVGPSRDGARLEGSKAFAKQFLERHRIPTARVYGICDSADEARRALAKVNGPVVLKADGLCAGKGVLVTSSAREAEEFIERAMVRREFGEGGSRLMLEEALAGRELSFIVLADGRSFVPMALAQDHKRVYDDDQGPNTGGMGAYSIDDLIAPELRRTIVESVVAPTLEGLVADGCAYRGFLYFGLMLTASGPKVLEFNCRLGDPETQAILPRMDSDLAETFVALSEGALDRAPIRWKCDASLCVVMASQGYPGSYETGKTIEGLQEAGAIPGVAIFHSGTQLVPGHSGTQRAPGRSGGKLADEKYVTSGGRVLAVTALGGNLEDARRGAYQAVCKIRFPGAHYRKDIGRAATLLERPAVRA